MSFREFLENLQNSSPNRKRRWLVGLTTIVMFVVLVIWLQSFNNLVTSTNSAAPETRSFTFGETFRAGLAVVRDAIVSGVHRITSLVAAPKSITVKP